jgi:hypothetical protein
MLFGSLGTTESPCGDRRLSTVGVALNSERQHGAHLRRGAQHDVRMVTEAASSGAAAGRNWGGDAVPRALYQAKADGRDRIVEAASLPSA